MAEHFRKYYKIFLFLFFVIISYYISSFYDKTGLGIYYLVAISIFVLGFTKLTLIKDLGLSFKIFKNKNIYFFLIPSIILSNIILILIFKYYMNGEEQFDNDDHILEYLLVFIFLNSIRTFGEEIIFRGFLLIKEIKNSNLLFWLLNIAQALLFSLIHSSFPEELISKIIFGVYVFLLTIYFGWLNRKFDSLIPSWVIHWMNGIQTLILAYFL